jgi:hypothetical protein
MKVALCLSGQPRNAMDMAPKIYNTIIKKYDTDVFMHVWFDANNLNFNKRCPGHWNRQSDANIVEKLINFYKPKSTIFDKPKAWSNPNIPYWHETIELCWPYAFDDPEGLQKFWEYTVNRHYSMWYSIMKCNFLKEEYAIDKQIKYDAVIKLRFDVSPNIDLNLTKLNYKSDILYYQNLNQPCNMISDWFAMGSNSVMNVWSNTYYYIEFLYWQLRNANERWCNEMMARNHLQNNNIKTEAIDLQIKF